MSFDPATKWKPVQTGIQLSILSILGLVDMMLPRQPYLLTSRLSQDCLENLLTSIRLHGPTPTARELRSLLKLITVSQYLKSSEKGNYQTDEREYLAEILSAQSTEPSSTSDNNEDAAIELVETEPSEMEESSLYYLVGYCLGNLMRTKELTCEPCIKTAISSKPPKDIGLLTLLKEYKEGILFIQLRG